MQPADGGEKEALRRKWGLPVGDRILLHIGHLREGRNLSALPPLAAVPGTTVLVVALISIPALVLQPAQPTVVGCFAPRPVSELGLRV